MKYILKNEKIMLLFILDIFVAIFIAINLKNNFYQLYLGYLSNAFSRYFFITTTIIFNYLVYKYLFDSIKFFRYRSKSRLLNISFFYEFILNFFFFAIYNIIIIIFNMPVSLYCLSDILLTILNYIIISVTISCLIKLIDIFVNKIFLSSIIFLFFFACIDFLLDYFCFFLFDNSIFNFSDMYIINYVYNNRILVFVLTLIFDIIIFNIINILFYKKDFLGEKDERNE